MYKAFTYILSLLVVLSCKIREPINDSSLSFATKSNCSLIKDCVSRIEVLPLETGGDLINGAHLFKETDSGFVIVDWNNTIYYFNDSGLLKKRIQRAGRGPAEYISIDDVDIDNQGNIYILCNIGYDVLVFSESGVFMRRGTLDTRASSLSILENDLICFTLCHEKESVYSLDRLLYTNAELTPIRSTLKLRETSASSMGFAEERIFKNSYSSSCLYYQSHDKTQYSIDYQGNIIETYTLDFGDYAVSEDYLQIPNEDMLMDIVMKHDFYYVSNAFESQNYLLFNVIFQQNINVKDVAIWLYDKNKHKSNIEHFSTEDSRLYKLLQLPIYMTNDDVVLFLCDNELLREYEGELDCLQSIDFPLTEGASLLMFHLK